MSEAAVAGDGPGEGRLSADDVKAVLARLVAGANLDSDEMAAVVGGFMDGVATPAQIGAFLTAMRCKGETVDEVVGAALAMRARMTRLPLHPDDEGRPMVDTCGTGGDGSGTVNISTLAAFIVAGCGLRVAKHGNRALSSRSGSHDVIEALGLDPAPSPELAARCVHEACLGFMFAPMYHAATKHVATARRELGFRTLFNVLGPLTNPAGASHVVNGVFAADRVEFVAQAHRQLGTRRALVVYGRSSGSGSGGQDEIAVRGTTLVAELRDGVVRSYEISPSDFGLPEADPAGLRGGEPADNARLLLAALEGAPGSIRTAALLNAGAAVFVVGAAADLREGAARAAHALDSGAARRVLTTLQTLAPRPVAG